MKTPFSFRALATLLIVVAVSLAPGGPAQRTTITVLATTDLHGNIYPIDYFTNKPANRGLAKLATLIAEEHRAHPDAILLDCGDTIEGSPVEYVQQRQVREKGNEAPPDPMMIAMNYIGYDAMVVGNHEFNFGLPVLLKAEREASFPWISANIEPAATEEEALEVKKRQLKSVIDTMAERTFEPLYLNKVNGVQIAVVGLTTAAIPNWEPPEHIRGYRFQPLPEAARFWVHHAHEVRDADIVIVAAHSGLERDPATGEPAPDQMPNENAVYQIAAGTHGLDAVIFGHTHRELPGQTLNGVLLVQPKYWGQSLAELTFVLEREDATARWHLVEKHSRLIPVTAETIPDPKILELTKAYHDAAERYLDTPVADATEPLDGALGRVTDTAAVDAIHEVQLAAAHADVSLATMFDTSARVPKGPVTVRQIAALYVYDNMLMAVEITDQTLKDALEHSARYYNQYVPGQPGPLINPNVFGFNYETAEGVTYKVDISKPVGQRIVDLRFHGEPLKPDQKLRAAINSYRKAGGGGYTMFANAPVLWQSTKDIRQLMIDYYTEKKSIPPTTDNNWEVIPEAARKALLTEAQSAK